MSNEKVLRDALEEMRYWFEMQRKACSKGGSTWDIDQCNDQMDIIDAALASTAPPATADADELPPLWAGTLKSTH